MKHPETPTPTTREEALAAIDLAIKGLATLRAVVDHRDPASDAELPVDLFDEAAGDAEWVVNVLRLGYGGALDLT